MQSSSSTSLSSSFKPLSSPDALDQLQKISKDMVKNSEKTNARITNLEQDLLSKQQNEQLFDIADEKLSKVGENIGQPLSPEKTQEMRTLLDQVRTIIRAVGELDIPNNKKTHSQHDITVVG